MTTIKEVAKEAGVSVGTVSRALNNSGYVSAISRERIDKAIAKLNYQPNMIARTLFHKKSNVIGLVVPDITNPFFPEMTRAIEDVASELGYTVLLCNSDGSAEKEKQYLNMFKQNYVDGAILATHPKTPESWLEANFPVIAIDRADQKRFPSVTVNNVEGAKTAVQHLYNSGSSQIALIKGSNTAIPFLERYQGYFEEMNNLNLEPIIFETGNELKILENKAHQFFKRYPEVDALFVATM
ncbi:Sucrose operon repressor [Lentibacillus sp. JNUCC-1]|nr:Sucrose operon repressor [Lentibacillus sp. JNUCC-1]